MFEKYQNSFASAKITRVTPLKLVSLKTSTTKYLYDLYKKYMYYKNVAYNKYRGKKRFFWRKNFGKYFFLSLHGYIIFIITSLDSRPSTPFYLPNGWHVYFNKQRISMPPYFLGMSWFLILFKACSFHSKIIVKWIWLNVLLQYSFWTFFWRIFYPSTSLILIDLSSLGADSQFHDPSLWPKFIIVYLLIRLWHLNSQMFWLEYFSLAFCISTLNIVQFFLNWT